MEKRQEKIIRIVRLLIGKPYKYGASPSEAPAIFDCSSFVQYVFAQLGVELPRSSIEQAGIGETVDPDDIAIGDLIFLRGVVGYYNQKYPQGIGHVMLYIGDNKVIQARSKENEAGEEEGVVEETSLDEAIGRSGPLVVIRRVL